jgi:hypothetical protein
MTLQRDLEEVETFLQSPARRRNCESLETHLTSAVGLTRSLWELLSGNEDRSFDPRTRLALEELASAAADHASAALYCLYRENEAPPPAAKRP